MMESKKCNKCGELKPKNLFSKRSISVDGLQYKCKQCEKEAKQSWFINNPEKAKISKEKMKHWRSENVEKCNQISRRWARENKEKARAWAIANPEKYKKSKLEWKKAHPGKVIETRIKAKKKAREGLSDSYVVDVLCNIQGISAALITKELIDAKRVHLKITRKLKELKA